MLLTEFWNISQTCIGQKGENKCSPTPEMTLERAPRPRFPCSIEEWSFSHYQRPLVLNYEVTLTLYYYSPTKCQVLCKPYLEFS